MDRFQKVATITDLEALYGTPAGASLLKVVDRLTPAYRSWIDRSRFCIIGTVGPEGTDGSPRGDDEAVVTILDNKTLALPDWHGNNRIDTLRNIVRDPRVSLMFMVPGANNVIRVNGKAIVTADPDLITRFERNGKHPRSVVVITIEEIYSQCARALIRSALWAAGDETAGLPTMGQILAEISNGDFDGDSYDSEWPERAKTSMW